MRIGADVAELLDRLGLGIGASQVEIVDFKQAESCYIHHTQVPVALTGYALVSPAFARGRFPKLSFIDLIHKRPSMGEIEACAIAAVCGAEVVPPFWSNPEPFSDHLWSVIARHGLEPFFERVGERYRFGSRGGPLSDAAPGFQLEQSGSAGDPGCIGQVARRLQETATCTAADGCDDPPALPAGR